MNCEECGKKPATVHITKVENGKKTDMHLCEQCALQKNGIGINTSFSINDLLAGLLNTSGLVPIKVDFTQDIKCSICGLSFSKFRETGHFGCSSCYKTFGERLNPLLKKVHGNTTHTGKVPNKAGGRIKLLREVEKLKQELEAAVRSEEYEKAAQLRDKIRELSGNGKGGL
ncbi:MAG: UvrB/UvrC motif-containing protein [Bacillota bacterium]